MSSPEPSPAEQERFRSYYSRWVVLREMAVLEPYDSITFSRKSDSLMTHYEFADADIRRMTAYFQDSLPRWEEFLSGIRDSVELRRRASGAVTPD